MPGFPTLLVRYKALLRRMAVGLAAAVILALAGLAALILTRDYAAIEQAILARYEQDLGLTLRFGQRRHVMWPKPKIVYDDVAVRRIAGDGELRAPQAIIQFDLFDLMDGSIDGPSLSLSKPDIRVDVGAIDARFRSPRSVTELLDQTIGLFGQSTRFSRFRIAVDEARFTFSRAGPKGEDLAFEAVRGRFRYLAGRGRLDVDLTQIGVDDGYSLTASLPTRRALAEDKQGAATIQIGALGSRLSFAGSMRRDPDLALIGRAEAHLGGKLERRLGGPNARPGSNDPPMTISSNMALDPRGVALEALRVVRGGKQLNGIAALRENNGRWGLSATLAGDLVDGTAAHSAFQRLRQPDGSWSGEPLAINPLPIIDLDIRLSTREFKLGNVVLANVALSILTRQGRTELAIVDSRFGEGMVKARVSLIDTPERQQELRLQASAERIDFGRFMERAFGFNRLTGEGTLVVQAEAKGASVSTLAGALNGTAAIDIKNGDVTGIDLAKLLTRATDARQDAALLFALAGKTSFEMLRANFAIREGKIEPVGSSFLSPRVTAMLEGVMDLAAQRHQMVVVLRRRIDEPPLPSEFYAFRLEGPLLAPSVRPDLRLLQNRS
ncbi:MAG: AsmA family protein [Beijerinckiaceae bacterium]|nr:AsmA family protein [Beijerinckiaceae bacterium]